MKTNKKSFILYTDTYESLKMLPDLEKGRLLTAIFQYVIEGKETVQKPETKMAFSFIKKQLDRDAEKWGTICVRNRNNIEKRWKNVPKKSTKNTSGISGIPEALDSDNDSDNDNDKEEKKIQNFSVEKTGPLKKLTPEQKKALWAHAEELSRRPV